MNKEIFVVGTLSYNPDKKEISFYFHHSISSPSTTLDIDAKEIIDPVHHIT
jgi:hypothetical protein